jgi:3-hydroxyacyl-CoA dehydrogenase
VFNNISVIGSGLMGSAIAAHFANARCEVILLDIVRRGYI